MQDWEFIIYVNKNPDEAHSWILLFSPFDSSRDDNFSLGDLAHITCIYMEMFHRRRG